MEKIYQKSKLIQANTQDLFCQWIQKSLEKETSLNLFEFKLNSVLIKNQNKLKVWGLFVIKE